MLSAADLPANWRDHIEVVTRKRSKVRVNEVADDDLDPFEALASGQKIIPLDDSHKAQIEALQRSHYTTLWIADHHLLQTHTCALKQLMDGPEGKELKLVGVFETNSQGRNPGNPNCFLFPLPNGGLAGLPLLARRRGGRDLDPGRRRVDHLLLQPPARPGDRRQGRTAASKTRTRRATSSRAPTTP